VGILAVPGRHYPSERREQAAVDVGERNRSISERGRFLSASAMEISRGEWGWRETEEGGGNLEGDFVSSQTSFPKISSQTNSTCLVYPELVSGLISGDYADPELISRDYTPNEMDHFPPRHSCRNVQCDPSHSFWSESIQVSFFFCAVIMHPKTIVTI
jgi:hypothetical protein